MRTALSIGMFDGVHKGHEALVDTLLKGAEKYDCFPCIVTFDTHPLVCLDEPRAPKLITLAHEKKAVLAGLGIEHVHVITAEAHVFQKGPSEFLASLVKDLSMDVCFAALGYDFRFGRERTGTAKDMRVFFGLSMEKCRVVGPVKSAGRIISSTRIRGLLRKGDMLAVNELLSRPYFIAAPVIKGEGIAGKLGYPTINLEAYERKMYPADGVYGVTVELETGDTVWPGVCNIMGEKVEIHMLDYNEGLVLSGTRAECRFSMKIRDIMRGIAPDMLIKQIRKDVQQVRDCMRCSS